MSTGLTVGAILIGAVTAALFWAQPLTTKVKMFGLVLLLGIVMAAVRLSFGHNDGVLNALTSPPSWKLLAIAAATVGLGISILWSLLKPRSTPKKK